LRCLFLPFAANGLQGLPWAIMGIGTHILGLVKSGFQHTALECVYPHWPCHHKIELFKPVYQQQKIIFRCSLLPIATHDLQGLPWAVIGIDTHFWGLNNWFFNTQHMSVYTVIALCHNIIELFKPIYKQPKKLYTCPLLPVATHGLQGLPWAIMGIDTHV
jgi:hypothetical protein